MANDRVVVGLGRRGASTVVEGPDDPTSFELVQDSAYVVGLPGEIWQIEDVNGPARGR